MKQSGIAVLLAFLVSLSYPSPTTAAPTSADQAQHAVINWLAANSTPLDTVLGETVRDVVSFADEDNTPLYYIVYLNPEGFVIVAGDDQVEPIIGFAPHGFYDPSPDTPLGALVSQDLPQRIARVREIQSNPKSAVAATPAFHQSITKAHDKWLFLSGEVPLLYSPIAYDLYLPPSDLRVAQLLETEWNQAQELGGENCYNLYTPNTSVCGCVATAMAQVMKFFEWPTSAVGTPEFAVTIEGEPATLSLRGGDGVGGAYNWALMDDGPTVPESSHREAIGALTSDVGISVHMNYTLSESGAYVHFVGNALVNTFDYSNAVHVSGQGSFWLEYFVDNVFNPNLDAGLPMVVGVYGHAVVFDGYGHDTSTLYHHVNMGWGGSWDLWYNVYDSVGGYGVFSDAISNIYRTGSGIIISGRVTDSNGDPLADVQVTAEQRDGGTHMSTTNDKGIYAFTKIPSLSGDYTLTAEKSGVSFSESKYLRSENISRFDVVNIGGVDFTAGASTYPDLIITESSVTDSTVTLAEQVIIHAPITNQGTVSAPKTWIQFYLSTDETISVSDTLLSGALAPPFEQINPLAAGAQRTFSLTTPAPANTGDYWYGSCVMGVTNESNTWNNCSEGVPVTIVPPIPAPPANISASSGDFADHISVTYTEATYAASYLLYRCTTEDVGSCSLIPDVKTRFYDDYGITDGNIYYYRVKACNDTGCSDYSWASGGYMAVLPSIPVGISASDGSYTNLVSVKWKESSNHPRYYTVSRCTSASSTSCVVTSEQGGLFFMDSAVVQEKVYYYRIQACNMAGCSDYSIYDTGYSSNSAAEGDLYEPDDLSEQASILAYEGEDTTQIHSILPAWDIDWAKFSIGSTQCIHLATASNSGDNSGDTRLWLYDSNFREIAFDDNSGPINFSAIDMARLGAGTYYVKVDEKGNNAEILSYLLTLQFCESPRVLVLPGIFNILLKDTP